MSLGYEPGIVPEDWDSSWVEEEFQRLSEILSKLGIERSVMYPQAVEPDKLEEGMFINADGTNWNPGFGSGLYIYENGRWEPMSGKDFLLEVSKGNVPGHALIHKFGANDALGTTTEDIWEVGGSMVFPIAEDTVDIVSASANDALTGTHARTVTITGTNFAGAVVTETLDMNGLTAVTSTVNFYRVTTASVASVGGLGATNRGNPNAGDITISGTTTTNTMAFISAEDSRTNSTHYTIPAGKTGYLLRVSITMDTGKAVNVSQMVRFNNDDVVVPVSPHLHSAHWLGIDTPIEDTYKAPEACPEKADVWFEGEATVGTAVVSVAYDILLVDNVI